MKTSWIKLVQYVGTTQGHDISNELHNRMTVIIVEPAHDQVILTHHVAREQLVCNNQVNMHTACEAKRVQLQNIVDGNAADMDPNIHVELAKVMNKIAVGK